MKDISLLKQFYSQVEKTPASVAIISQGQRLLYRDLKKRVLQCANALINLNVKPKDKVVLYHFKDADMLVVILALLNIGATCLAYDVAQIPRALKPSLENEKPKLIIKSPQLITASDSTIINSSELFNAKSLFANECVAEGVLYGESAEEMFHYFEHARQRIFPHSFRRSLAFSLESAKEIFLQFIFPLLVGGTVVVTENLLELPTLGHLSLLSVSEALLAKLLDMQVLPKALDTIIISDRKMVSIKLTDRIHSQMKAITICNQEFDILSYCCDDVIDDVTVELRSSNDSIHSYTQSEDEVIATMKLIWHRLLDLEEGFEDRSFFELSQDSAVLMRLATELKHEFHINISVKDIILAPTIKQLTLYVMNALSEKRIADRLKYNALVCLNPNGRGEPIFLIHSIDGVGHFYWPLAKYLDCDRPIYLIQDLVHHSDQSYCASLEDLASRAVSQIKRVQAQGSYHLLGCSYGGLLAVEVMKQLKAQQAAIGFFGLIDSWAQYPQSFDSLDRLQMNIDTQRKLVAARISQFDYPEVDDLLIHSFERLQLSMAYQLGFIDESLVLFKAAETSLEYSSMDNAMNGWQKYCLQSVKKVMVPGNHDTMVFEPNIQVIAKAINHMLAPKAEASSFSRVPTSALALKKL